MQIYEDHKKSEVKPTNRPISSYQRIPSPMGSVANQESKSIQEQKASYEELIQLLNNFLIKNRITRSKFCDNPTIFFLLSDFKELFITLHFPISSSDITTLFETNNKNAKDGYINLSDFMKELMFYKGKSICYNLSSNSISHQDSISSESMNILEMKNLNEDYIKFNKDINSILREDRKTMAKNNQLSSSFVSISTSSDQRRRIQTAKPKPKKMSIDSTGNNFDNNQNKNQTVESLPNINNQKDNNQSGNKKRLPPKPKYDPDKIIEEMKRENQKEEEQIRSDFEKRTRAFIKDCIYKCAEANKMCKELNIARDFQIVDDNGIKVQIIENNESERYIELKAFVVEWRMTQKAYLQKQNEKIYAINENSKTKKDKVNQVLAKKNEKKEKLDEVKKVLIDTVRLKMKLKNQLDSLQKTIKVDENIVIEHLVKAGIDIPGYYSTNID